MKALLIVLFFSTSLDAQLIQRPVVFVHGFLASGDTWNKPYSIFLQNGYSSKQFQVFDWNTIGGKNSDSLLNVFIDSILSINNVSTLDLVGHSAGGGLCNRYCANPSFSKKIAHYVHIGSSKLNKPVGSNNEIPTMVIYSSDDLVAKNAGETEGATNIKFTAKDHYEVATCNESIEKMFVFFNGFNPNFELKKKKKEVSVAIRCLNFASNEIIANTDVIVQQYQANSGLFIGDKKVYKSNENGWLNLKVIPKDKNLYALSIQPTAKSRKVTYFFEQINTDRLISLRAFNTNNMIGMLLAQLPKDTIQPAICIFTSHKAVVSGRDTLSINGTPLSSAVLTPANKTIIATFVYDNGDKKSSGTKHQALANAPFMNGIDVFTPYGANREILIEYNGRKHRIPFLKSNESISVIVLD